jgi:hypothetical protein
VARKRCLYKQRTSTLAAYVHDARPLRAFNFCYMPRADDTLATSVPERWNLQDVFHFNSSHDALACTDALEMLAMAVGPVGACTL